MECALRQLRPTTLDAALLSRLEGCTANTWTEPTPETLRLAQQLQSLAPANLPASLKISLEALVSTVEFPKNTNILTFPQSQHPARNHARTWWSAAAAVALIGALSALIVPPRHETHRFTGGPSKSQNALPTRSSAHLVPASFNRGLTETHDEGVIWPSNEPAQRVLKVVYTDRVTLKDATGQTYQVEQPRVEYILVPAKAD